MSLAIATALTAPPLHAQSVASAGGSDSPTSAAQPTLEAQFRDPPSSARPRVWWHWMNGNITKDGITKDLAWMKRVGIGGAQAFDANLKTPQIVDKRLVYMSPEWKDAFRFAAQEAHRLDLELAVASSPGYSETGGPWVPPQDALKKLVWSETALQGGRPFRGKIAQPPSVTGPYLSLKADTTGGRELSGGEALPLPAPTYTDVALLAVPEMSGRGRTPSTAAIPVYADGAGKPLDGSALTDDSLESAIEIARPTSGSPVLQVTYAKPQTIRSASVFMPGTGNLFFGGSMLPELESSADGSTWSRVATLPTQLVPTTVSFPAVTARHFRIVFERAPSGALSFAPPAPGVDLAVMAGAGASMLKPKPLLVADLRLSAKDSVDRFEAKAGFAVVPDYYALSRDVPDGPGIAPAQVIDLTGRLKPDGTLDWTPPPGRWTVLRLGSSLVGTMNHPATLEATGLEVDKYDGPAVRRYLDHYIGMFKDAAGAELVGRHGLNALLTDSIEVGASNWTPRLVEQFRRLRGYDPLPWLPALTGTIIGSRARSDQFLYDFRRTLADLLASEHYGTLAQVAHENGLTVYGEALENGRPSLGDDLAMRAHADVPMGALWTYPRKSGPRPAYIADMKGAASVGHLYGRAAVAAESMTSLLAPWAHGPADLKRIVDLEFATGINRPVVHTSVHVPVDDKQPGLALSIFGQYFNRNESWAELARPWVDYIARNSFMLQQGKNVADVAYFYGEEAPLSALYQDKEVADAPRSVAYDFINADALTQILTNDGADLVTPGGARYRVLYLGGTSRHMTLPVLRRIAALAEGGATIVGLKPSTNPSLAGTADEFSALTEKLWPAGGVAHIGRGQVIASNDIEAALVQAGVKPDFRIEGGQADTQVLFVHRRLADGDSYFLSNRKDRAETFSAHFRVSGRVPELWHPETGTSEPLSYRSEGGETIVPLSLAADEAVHVVFRKPANAPALAIKKVAPVEIGRIETPWTVRFQSGRGAPAQARFAKLAPLDENTDPAIKYFSGIATYTNTFTTPRGWKRGQPLWLNLGEAREVAEVKLNGQPAGYAWHAPYRVDIAALAKPGRNKLEIRVANLWVNRMIGDRQPGAEKVTWTASPTYTAKAPLRRSGLIGPVSLQGIATP
ncbi:hypothetical protein HNO88_002211 [Novosphingobium chloroacetimidivorans]|uniref:Beta-mannosidase-like galactose-binding domain-containing protein n=1 Tax=Novosphingobium chloroacetimidivorans TaxID=1428314 RepID=A0A7W7KAA1_9SPHN|nr:glycosyl hydrolase [Novosphingobium chloroacetimidivorans]MBB4858885.1 hypothetical protein [Novosphingobium chloroacetimidivorans]